MNRLFDEVMGTGPSFGGGHAGQCGQGQIITAQMSVSETESQIGVAAELPGVREDDIDISPNDDILTIRGEKRMERQDEKETFHFVERSFGTVQRSVRLPFPVDPDQVKASFDNGVLTVTLPKTAQQHRTRRIQVQRGTGHSSRSGQMIQGETTALGDQQHQQGGNGREAGQRVGSKGDHQQG